MIAVRERLSVTFFAAGLALVRSEARPGECYEVSLIHGACSCPEYRGRCVAPSEECRHLQTAKVAQAAEQAERWSQGRELARRMGSPDLERLMREASAEGKEDLALCCYAELQDRQWLRGEEGTKWVPAGSRDENG